MLTLSTETLSICASECWLLQLWGVWNFDCSAVFHFGNDEVVILFGIYLKAYGGFQAQNHEKHWLKLVRSACPRPVLLVQETKILTRICWLVIDELLVSSCRAYVPLLCL